MKRAAPLALAILVASHAEGLPAVLSDCALDGTWDTRTGRQVEVQEFSREKVEAILDEVESQFGSALADEIRNAMNAGRVAVGVIPPWQGIYGTHDWNTIGISPYATTPALAAIVLAHEWTHVERCSGGPSQGGTTYDPSGGTASNPCGPVSHMGDTSDSIHKACARLESADASLGEKLCKLIRGLVDALVSQAGEAAAAGCPHGSIPDPLSYVAIACLDSCND